MLMDSNVWIMGNTNDNDGNLWLNISFKNSEKVGSFNFRLQKKLGAEIGYMDHYRVVANL